MEIKISDKELLNVLNGINTKGCNENSNEKNTNGISYSQLKKIILKFYTIMQSEDPQTALDDYACKNCIHRNEQGECPITGGFGCMQTDEEMIDLLMQASISEVNKEVDDNVD